MCKPSTEKNLVKLCPNENLAQDQIRKDILLSALAIMKKLNSILLIDDDAVTNYLNKILLEELQVAKEIAICTNGEKALNYLHTVCKSNISPELIFLDLNMPVLDGFGFLEKYKQTRLDEFCKSTIAVLSSSSNPRDRERVKITGLAHYLTKPLSAQQLEVLIDGLC